MLTAGVPDGRILSGPHLDRNSNCSGPFSFSGRADFFIVSCGTCLVWWLVKAVQTGPDAVQTKVQTKVAKHPVKTGVVQMVQTNHSFIKKFEERMRIEQ